jgi:hypothetical protein
VPGTELAAGWYLRIDAVYCAGAVAVLAGVAPAGAPRLLLIAVAVEVGAFAAVQLRLLRYGRDDG